jgi:hypothetical protein
MTDKASRWCVFLPCTRDEIWAVPQNCLAEIVTIQAADQYPPEQINWRGHEVPVLDLDDSGTTPWRDPLGETGLIAVILGLKDQGSDYWAVALRGEGLAVKNIAAEKIEESTENVLERSTSAFVLHNVVYQVPDLPELQKQVGMYRISA